jgi:Beta-galactosidase/beta-glucuronidase
MLFFCGHRIVTLVNKNNEEVAALMALPIRKILKALGFSYTETSNFRGRLIFQELFWKESFMKRGFVFLLILALLSTATVNFSQMTLVNRAQAAYTPEPNHREKYCFNYDWKFIKQDVAGAQAVSFNDSAWQNVSLPHTYNDVDHYDTWVTGSGDYGFAGKTWYRKHFKLDADKAGKKIFLEFEGVRQAAEFYINGNFVGRHENGVGPCGIDISDYVNFGSTENVLAVKVDNSLGYKEVATGVGYQWDTPPFNPMYGGIVKNVYLHVTDKVYQTLPLYSNLGTTGTYVYAQNINPIEKTADITAEAEVKNDGTDAKDVSLDMSVVDRDGNTVMTAQAQTQTVSPGQKTTFTATGNLTQMHMWFTEYPYLYKVFTTLRINGEAIDTVESPLGIRQVGFSVDKGLTLNGNFLYLKGYAPRSTTEWATVGMAPNWLEEYDMKMIKESNGNFIRPMHTAPKKADVEAADKFGIVYDCPAGDGEGDVTGRQWDQRLELMRDITIYFRNNPSILFYEGGNQFITYEHMSQMKAIRDQYDPHGGRLVGTRSNSDILKPVAEYLATMDNTGTSNTHPIWDDEYSRAEAPRRVWDKYSPPSFGYRNIAAPENNISEYPQDDFLLNSSEDLARMNVKKYNDRWSKRAGQGLASVMVGGAKIIFADSISHGRMTKTELARVSGAVDAVRLPKETYFALQTVQNVNPEVYILGHWSYPAGTVKNMYVISNCDEVRLVTYDDNGNILHDYGYGTKSNNFEFGFNNVAWQSGKIKAIGYKGGVQAAEQTLATAGAPAKIELTPVVGPQGFRADGSDIAMFDVEVVDANGNRCPTDEGRIDFKYSGQGKFLGGYNSGIQNSIFKDYLNTECGINRVFVRANRTSGNFTLTASRDGLEPATVSITSIPVSDTNGLSTEKPQGYAVPLGNEPAIDPNLPDNPDEPGEPGGPTSSDTLNAVMVDFSYTGTHGDSLTPPQPNAHIVHNAQAGSKAYIDSAAVLPALPDYLKGGDYIQAFLRDAPDGSSTDLYQFFTNKFCYIYQLIDAANPMPVHNNNENYQWEKLADTVTINGRVHNIYKSRLMSPGENGYFASNGHGIEVAPGSNLYMVFAVSAESEIQKPGQTIIGSTVQAGNIAENAIDGNPGTRWCAADGSYPQTMTIDLGQRYQIGGYDIDWFNNANRAYKYKIELSDDDVNYSLSVDKQTNTNVGISKDRTNTVNSRQGRYVKITVTGSTAGWASINDIKIYGVPGSATEVPSKVATPVVTPSAGTYAVPQSVTITDKETDAEIRYTTDGSIPSATNGTVYTGPFTVTQTATVKAIAYKPGMVNSDVSASLITISTDIVNLALNQTAKESEHEGGYIPSNAFDGNIKTRWSSVFSDPQWIYVDLGSEKNIHRVKLFWEAAYAKAYKIQVSDDAEQWEDAYTTEIGDGGTDDITFEPRNARYVRMYGTQRSTPYGYSLWEFEIY